MANVRENFPTLKQSLDNLFGESLKQISPDEQDIAPEVKPCNDLRHGDYQCNNAMGLFKILRNDVPEYRNPREIRQAILDKLPSSDMIESSSITGVGYVNAILSSKWMAKRIHNMLIDGIETWAPKLPVQRAIVDFSSPNIAKEMHVGHLMSTIIGDPGSYAGVLQC